MKKILFTGFEAFGGEEENPSWEAVAAMGEEIGGARIVKRCLPVSYGRAGVLLEEVIRKERPEAVACVGQAGGRRMITPELIAVNRMDAPSPDNDGVAYAGAPVRPEGPDGYFAKLPVKELAIAMQSAGIPVSVSCSAGLYVCNCLMYQLLHMIDLSYPAMRGGFIHVPYSCEQVARRQFAGQTADRPSLPLELITRGLETVL